MCRIEETVFQNRDGSKRSEEEVLYCEKADRRQGKICSKVKKRTTDYYNKAPSTISDGSSPGPFTPPTAGGGGYRTEVRRPSGAYRPSTGDEPRTIKPGFVIEFGGKNKTTKYPKITLATTSNKRSSLGASSVNSNDAALESPGSDASYTVRTGFPEAPIAPPTAYGEPPGYTTRHAVPQNHRHTASASSHAGSSRVPSLTSEPESPGRRLPRYPPALVHNPIPVSPLSPTVTRAPHVSTTTFSARSNYRTTTIAPQRSSRDNIGVDDVTPHDYSDFVRPVPSLNGSSTRAAAPEITDRAADRERMRRAAKKQQEEEDQRYAQDLEKEEERKQVRFELGRFEDRANQRAEARLAESDKDRAQAREEAREDAARRRKQQEPEKRATERPKREKTKPPANDFNRPRRAGSTSRRGSISMTREAKDERERLLQEEIAQTARERDAADRRDREEQLAERGSSLLQRQETSEYYNPRTSDRVTDTSSGLSGRRPSVSRRSSVSSTAPPTGLGRSHGKRGVSIIHQNAPPAPPSLTTSFQPQQQFSTRPPSSHLQNAPSLPYQAPYTLTTRPPSARHSLHHENPFAQPSTRTSNTSQDNPFAAPSTRPIHPSHPPPDGHHYSLSSSVLQSPAVTTHDPWDARELRANLPQTTAYPRNAMQMAGEQVINRSGDRAHGRARQATRNMGTAMGYADADETSSEEEVEQRSRGPRAGTLGEGRGKRRL